MLLLLHLVGPEARRNAELYSTAQSKGQAAKLYKLAAQMVRMSSTLSAYIVIRDSVKSLFCPELGTEYRALSAEVPTAFGLSPVLVIHDELGQVPGEVFDLYDALETAQGAQADPLSIVISTQAATDAALLSTLIDDAQKGEDPKTKLWFWTAPKEDDPFLESTWHKANPLLGDVLNIDVVRDMAEKARRMPARESAFRNLVLNQRIDSSPSLIGLQVWKECNAKPDDDVISSGLVYAGLDLSSRHDLTALVYGTQDESKAWHVKAEFWAPEKGLSDRSRRDRVPYDLWAREGWITMTPGASVDYDFVAHRLAELCADLDVVAIAFDRWHIDQLRQALDRIGVVLPLVAHGQGYRDMSPAVDAVEGALLNEQVRHGDNPVLTWCALNAKAISDPAGNRKLDKKKSTGRIDGLVSMAMMFRAETLAGEPAKPKAPSVYESGRI